jgi:glycerol uptake facilitator-like aquaporin
VTGLGRRLAVEAIGTALLVATVVGSGIMAQTLTDDRALALLGNTLPTGAILVVLIATLGPISGAHLNPAVTLVFAMRQQINASDALLYALVQITAGVFGTMAAHLMFNHTVIELSTTTRTGAAQWFSECVATFGLVLVIVLGLAHNRQQVPWLVGLYISAAYWFTASTSFANPAVTIARVLTDSFSGIRPIDAPAFIVAQLVGAVLAAAAARGILGPNVGR